MKSLTRIALFLSTALLACRSLAVSDYVVVISDSPWSEPGWKTVAETLQQQHQGQLVRYAADPSQALSALKETLPRYACFVTPPRDASRDFATKVRRLVREFDPDPFTDCFWGILTGYDSTNALRIAQRSEPLTIRKVGSGTPIPLDAFEEGVWFSELQAGQISRKTKGNTAVEEAAAAGLRTAFVPRPDEHGPGRGEGRASVPVDVSAADLVDLADRLGGA